MGNAPMGNTVSNSWSLLVHPEITPDPRKEPINEPLQGFPNGRKEREMIATEEEMQSAKIPLKYRDYCAHHLLKYGACRKDNWPWAVACAHEKHTYLQCQYDDWILRMKEYERERRLMVKRQAAAA